jgi:hypothetical protein
MTKLTSVSKANPCPHCGKPDWCYSIGDLSVCNRDHEPANGWTKTKGVDMLGKPYYALIESQVKKESAKPTIIKTTYYEYPDRQGKPLVRSVRHDLSDGEKKVYQESWTGTTWTKTTKHIDRSSIPIYRLAEVTAAITQGKQIFWVEGEPCADILYKLGLVATTNFGGSGRLSPSDLDDLAGADLVICPDRDTPGLKLADKVAQRFPIAKWLYAFPNSPLWSNPPANKGADVKNWINDYSLTSKDLLLAVEDRREINSEAQKLKVLGFSEVEQEKLKLIRGQIDELIYLKKTESEKLAFLTQLAMISRWDDSKLKSYYHLRLKELEDEDSKEETQSEIDQILESLNDDISLEYLVHPDLIPDLEKLGDKLRYKNASILTAMLTAVSVLHKVGTLICLADLWFISFSIWTRQVTNDESLGNYSILSYRN